MRIFSRILLLACVVTFLGIMTAGCGPRTVEGCLKKAGEKAQKNDWANALHYANRAVELSPDSVTALLFQAIAAEHCGKNDLAYDSAARAVQCDPKSFVAQFTLGRLCAADASRRPQAAQALLRAMALDRNQPAPLIEMINLARRTQSAAAFSCLLRLSKLPGYEEDSTLANELGVEYVRRGELALARRQFLKACRNGTNLPIPVLNFGTYMEKYARNRRIAAKLYQSFLTMTDNERKDEFSVLREDVRGRLARIGR